MPWIILTTGLANFLLGLFVWLRNKRRRLNIYFLIFSINTAILITFDFVLRFVPTIFVLKNAYAFAALVPATGLWWIIKLCDIQLSNIKKFLLWLSPFIFFLLSYGNNLVIQSLDYLTFAGFKGENGPIFVFYSLYMLFYILAIIFTLYSKLKTTAGLKRLQIKYVLLGVTFFGVSAAFFSLILPAFFNQYGLLSMDGPSSIFFVSFAAYAIVRYRLMDIRVIVKRSTVFAVLVAVITGLYTLITAIVADIFGFSPAGTGFILAVLVALGFDPLKRWLSETTDSFLFKGEYKPQVFLEELTGRISSTLNIRHIFSDVIELFDAAFHPSKQALLVAVDGGRHFTLGEAEGFINEDSLAVSFKRTNPLVNFFKKHREPVVAEEYDRRYGDDPYQHRGMRQFLKEMEKRDIALYLPLHSKDKLIGLLMFGHKKSGDVYTDQDIRVLDIASSHLAVAIENARLYEEMKDFNLALQKEVEKATRALRDANMELKNLDRAKSEFISIASHQLRTPMTVIKGYISMLLEGSFGKIPQEEIEPLKKVYDSNSRLIQLIESLLNISRIESGKLKYEFAKMDLAVLVDSVVDELKRNAEAKGLVLVWRKPEKPLPKVTIDAEKLRQVILNLIDNAIKYTPKGKVEVSVVKEKENVVFRVKDTGLGMTSEEMVGLFKKFSRGSKQKRLEFTGGSGLGLYVGRMMVEVHGGKIWAESSGKDKGSTFAFSLPLKPGTLPKLPKESKIMKSEK